MSNISLFANAGLPAVQSLATSLRSLSMDVGSGGVAILKMDKTGHWVFGADQTEVQDGAIWAVNPFSFTHGYIAWGKGEVLGEKMVRIDQPLPELPAAPAGADKGWETQIGMSLKCLNGEDEGMEARYSVTSVGGKKAAQAIAVAIAAQVEIDQTNPVPKVALGSEHYQHKTFGRIYTPIFKVVGWMGMGGEAEAQPAAAPAAIEAPAAAPAAPARRRRAVVA